MPASACALLASLPAHRLASLLLFTSTLVWGVRAACSVLQEPTFLEGFMRLLVVIQPERLRSPIYRPSAVHLTRLQPYQFDANQ